MCFTLLRNEFKVGVRMACPCAFCCRCSPCHALRRGPAHLQPSPFPFSPPAPQTHRRSPPLPVRPFNRAASSGCRRLSENMRGPALCVRARPTLGPSRPGRYRALAGEELPRARCAPTGRGLRSMDVPRATRALTGPPSWRAQISPAGRACGRAEIALRCRRCR